MSNNKKTGAFTGWAIVSNFGAQMIASIVIGFFVGKFIDGKLGTEPLFILLFIFLGIGAGFRNLYLAIIKGSENDGNE